MPIAERSLLRPVLYAVSLLAATSATPETATTEETPRLIVLMVVDQMRSDYVERYGERWSAGLRRLFADGAHFTEAAYPYFNTVTCAGQATIGTGSFPHRHGMAFNRRWDRTQARRRSCTDDPEFPIVSYGAPVEGGHSPVALVVPTLADQLREKRAGRVVSVSLKARSAITLAGHGGELVLWFDEVVGAWTTSRYYAEKPLDFVAEALATDPVEGTLGREWSRLLPLDSYRNSDVAAGATSPVFATARLPHRLESHGDGPDPWFYEAWRTSPFSDEALARLARIAVEKLELGRGPGTDLLAVSFSALDLVGHDFGPDSHEVQDVLFRLDRQIGQLLETLDEVVGAGRWALGFSADHGVAPIPEARTAAGLDAGRIDVKNLAARIDGVLASAWGGGPYVADVYSTSVYLTPGSWDRLSTDHTLRAHVEEAVRSTAGVADTFFCDELDDPETASTAQQRAAALSHHHGPSGDILFLPRRHWLTTQTDATSHGTPYDYDQRVPVVLYGPAFRAGRYSEPATPADIAPSLAALVGLTLPDAEGRVLTEALQPAR